jgi:DNA mismatch endonuclease Vsr
MGFGEEAGGITMDRLTKDQRRKNMQAVKATGSKIEIILAKALFILGYHYRKNNKTVFGKPDFTIRKRPKRIISWYSSNNK